MRQFLLLLVATTVLYSCQKEVSPQPTMGLLPADSAITPLPDGAVWLTKMVYKESGSFTYEFTYDGAGRLAKKQLVNSATNAASSLFYEYNNQGRLYKIKDDTGGTAALVAYQSQASDAVAFIGRVAPGTDSIVFRDVVYTYTGNRVSKIEKFRTGNPARAEFYETWDYDDYGNPTQLTWYTLDTATSNYKLNFTYEFLYDDKVNPLQFGPSFLDWTWSATAPNNMVQQKNIYPDGTTEVLTTTYEYRPDGYPSVAHFNDGGTRTAETYYYYNK